ncbi:transglycosylase SLT domain-containing protein [Ascidiaceihabitans sp.]|nr:transglycosylase SLT domain-containing protein [Ascidiaceihabitans sp.]
MKKSIGAMILILAVASCGGGSGGGSSNAPRNLDNACSIVQEKPQYLRAFRAAERKWNVPVHVLMAVIYQESKFKSNARPPFRYSAGVIPVGRQSSALGYSQALAATWKEYQVATGSRSARRTNIKDAADFMGWYMNITRKRNGVSLNDARNQYFAYHDGHTGFSRGTYKNKAWLVRVAGEVESRANTYRSQLANCGSNWRA